MTTVYNQTKQPQLFDSPQWVITPTSPGKYLMVLSGGVWISLTPRNASSVVEDYVIELPDSLNNAGGWVGVRTAQPFTVEQYAAYASVTEFFDKATAVDSGFAIMAVVPSFVPGGRTANGIQFRLAVEDSDATIRRIGYQLTLVGHY